MTYQLRSSASQGEAWVVLNCDQLGNFTVQTKGEARPLVNLLRVIADVVEMDAALTGPTQ